MARKKKGKAKKKAKENLVTAESEYGKAPHTFVFHRGTVGKSVLQLLLDIRRTMEPYTAASLRTRKKNVLKDFVSVASPLGVTHFMVFTKTDTGTNVRIIKIPRGPTITFKITQYSLAKDVLSSLKRPNMYASQFRYHPLLVLNNFSKEKPHLKLAATLLQNMFPSINVHKVQLNKIRRCVLFNYDPETELIEFRHYSIKLVPVGVSRSVKKLLKTKVPDLSRYKDVSDFFLNAGQLSESEAEQDGPDNEVTVPQNMSSRGNIAAQKSAIRLVEIGPRMQLQMVKIEEGMCEGEVIYHQFVHKTSQEIAEARTLRLQRMKAKEKRKKLQEASVDAKNKQKEEHKQKSLEGIKRKTEQVQVQEEKSAVKAVNEEQQEEVDDDTEYYRQEVGEDPDPALFPKKKHLPRTDKRKASSHSPRTDKRRAGSQGGRLPEKKAKFSSKSSKDSESNKARRGTKGESYRQGRQERTSSRTAKSFGKNSPAMRGGKKSGAFGRNANRKTSGSADRMHRRGHPAGKGGAANRNKGKVGGGKVLKKSKVKGR